MKLLAFDTATTACALALLDDGRLHCIDRVEPMQQSKLILPLIEELLQQAKLSLASLDAVAFGAGPGSFTGMRIAASVVQGLSLAADLPIIKLSTLAAMAQAVWLEKQWQKVLVVVDARMGQVYWGAYEVNAEGDMELVGQEHVSAPNEVISPFHAEWFGIGDGWIAYQAILATKGAPLAIHPQQLPTGQALAILAKRQYLRGEFVNIDEAHPSYLR